MTKPAVNAATARPDLATFYLKKGKLPNLLNCVARLQQRDDLSGKFARKVALIRRPLAALVDDLNEERQALVKAHAEKYPAGHDKAGEFKPVYMEEQGTGKPVFKKDENGNDTDERVVIPDQYALKDPELFTKDVRAMLEEYVAFTCPAFKLSELESFKNIRGEVMDALLDIEEGADSTAKPEGFSERPALELVKDEPKDEPAAPAAVEAEGDRTAP